MRVRVALHVAGRGIRLPALRSTRTRPRQTAARATSVRGGVTGTTGHCGSEDVVGIGFHWRVQQVLPEVKHESHRLPFEPEHDVVVGIGIDASAVLLRFGLRHFSGKAAHGLQHVGVPVKGRFGHGNAPLGRAAITVVDTRVITRPAQCHQLDVESFGKALGLFHQPLCT